MKNFTIFLTAVLLLSMAKVTLSQEWTPIFNFNGVNGQIATSNGDKVFTYQAYHFMNTSYEAMLSTDNGSTWAQVHDDKFATAFFNNQEDLYAVRQDKFPGTFLYFPQSIYLSTDDGSSWTTIDTVANNMGQVNASVFRMDNNGTMYTAFRDFGANTGGFKYSTDDGASWTLIPTFLSGPASYTDSYSALLTSNGDFFITTYNQGIYKSTDAGASWTNVYNSFITLAFLHEHPSTGDLYAASLGTVLKSTDNGENWVEVDPEPWMAMNIKEFEITSDGTFYFANLGGAYKSTDCIHWESIWVPDGKESRASSLLDMAISDNYVYISATDSTVYRKLRAGSTGINSLDASSSIHVYPNPAQNFVMVNINGSNSSSTQYNLKITDINGRLVYNTVLPYKGSIHKLDISMLQNGFYVISLNNGIQSLKQKLIVRK